jgi:hypothetical protein
LNPTSLTADESETLLLTSDAITQLCAPFLCVVEDRLEFYHASAKRFWSTEEFSGKKLVPQDEADEYLALKSLSKLSEPQYQQWQYAARLLHKNLLPHDFGWKTPGPTLNNSEFYRYACLHWQDQVTELSSPSEPVLSKLRQFLLGTEFVSASETLIGLKPNAGIGVHVLVRSTLQTWHDSLPPNLKEKVPIGNFYVAAHEDFSKTLNEEGGDILLQYLPFVRLGQYFFVGGKTNSDFQRATAYWTAVAEGYENALGPRNRLTLRAKTDLLRSYFTQ